MPGRYVLTTCQDCSFWNEKIKAQKQIQFQMRHCRKLLENDFKCVAKLSKKANKMNTGLQTRKAWPSYRQGMHKLRSNMRNEKRSCHHGRHRLLSVKQAFHISLSDLELSQRVTKSFLLILLSTANL